jgi:hypothetical protein
VPHPADKPGPEPAPKGLAVLKAEGRAQPPMVVRNVDDALRLGEIFVRSGFFDDSKAVSQAVVKILYGVELGLSPIVAMNSIDVVEGKCAPGAQLTAAKIRQHPLYRITVNERTAERCRITFYSRETRDSEWLEEGVSEWDHETAKRAGLLPAHAKSPWTKYPQAMLYARALTEGARAYCPDLFHGIAAYTVEELSGGDDAPEPIDLTPTPPPPAPAGAPEVVDGDQGPRLTPEAAASPEAEDLEPDVGEVKHPTGGPGGGDGTEPEDEARDDAAELVAAEFAAGDPETPPAPREESDEDREREAEAAGESSDTDAIPFPTSAEAAESAASATERAQEGPPAPAEASDPEAPAWPVQGPLPPHVLEHLTEPEAGSKDAVRAEARWLGLKAAAGMDELALVGIAEALGLPGSWAVADDDVLAAVKAAVHGRAAELEREAAA